MSTPVSFLLEDHSFHVPSQPSSWSEEAQTEPLANLPQAFGRPEALASCQGATLVSVFGGAEHDFNVNMIKTYNNKCSQDFQKMFLFARFMF